MLIQTLSKRLGLITVRFGLSEVRPESELTYGNDPDKEPDLLVYDEQTVTERQRQFLRDNRELVEVPRADLLAGGKLDWLLTKAIAAIEVEFSPYRAAEMKGRQWKPRSQERWEKRPVKHANPPTAPNIFVKEEDLPLLVHWQRHTHVPIIVAHLFDQEGFAISLETLFQFNKRYEDANEVGRIRLQVTTGIFKAIQRYDRVDAQGAAERKTVFRVAPCAAVKVGDLEGVKVSAQLGLSSSKKYVTQPLFSEGKLHITKEFVEYLRCGGVRAAPTS